MGSRTKALNHGFPNATSASNPQGWGTQGIKTFKYLQEKKSIEMLLVTASENSIRQTESVAEMQRRCGVLVHVLNS